MSKKILRLLLILLTVVFLSVSALCFASCGEKAQEGFLITFDDNRGASTEFNTYAVSGQVRTEVNGTLAAYPTPQRVGHDFVGWYTNADGTGEAVSVDNIFTKDTTLYAKWEPYPMAPGTQWTGGEDNNNPDYSGQTSPNVAQTRFSVAGDSFTCNFGVDGDDYRVRRSITMSKTDPGSNEGVVYYFYGEFGYYMGFFTLYAHLYFYEDNRVYALLDAIRPTESLGTWRASGGLIIFSTECIF